MSTDTIIEGVPCGIEPTFGGISAEGWGGVDIGDGGSNGLGDGGTEV